jgi:hypothetical protein
MKNQEDNNQLWQTPEIIDLDVDKTNGGVLPSLAERTEGDITFS